MDMTDWRQKADSDLTPEDLSEMRQLARPVSASGPIPAHGYIVRPVTSYSTPTPAGNDAFTLRQPQLLNA